ncbi:hypothetical protein F8154_03070 [Alkaliphilus pronyensis]|uniref:DinB family protein n=1 Tax=Alkaliphilus pronyensis TaxID=1482732 RepID=A0A6I0F466_9FIRM|nr:hypothetical protein [Alkaliphilus pronyensis]KAB3537290.1 hypothetical protein F8154_03070 [Alkaliphilus pronyensis]
MRIIVKHLHNAFNLTIDLVHAITTDDLKLQLMDLPSNTIGEQLWCIIGARESYLKAIINEGWMGFSCSLDDTTSKNEVLKCLKNSADDSLAYLNNAELNEKQTDLLLALLEHEIQHHGQLIRYFYGNKLTFPKSWTERYTV